MSNNRQNFIDIPDDFSINFDDLDLNELLSSEPKLMIPTTQQSLENPTEQTGDDAIRMRDEPANTSAHFAPQVTHPSESTTTTTRSIFEQQLNATNQMEEDQISVNFDNAPLAIDLTDSNDNSGTAAPQAFEPKNGIQFKATEDPHVLIAWVANAYDLKRIGNYIYKRFKNVNTPEEIRTLYNNKKICLSKNTAKLEITMSLASDVSLDRSFETIVNEILHFKSASKKIYSKVYFKAWGNNGVIYEAQNIEQIQSLLSQLHKRFLQVSDEIAALYSQGKIKFEAQGLFIIIKCDQPLPTGVSLLSLMNNRMQIFLRTSPSVENNPPKKNKMANTFFSTIIQIEKNGEEKKTDEQVTKRSRK